MWVNNPFGSDAADFNDETSADRIGRRIRQVRTAKGLSQAELGEKVGLNANRVQQYENGARKPKMELLKQFAAALGVETIALLDPVVANYIGMMYGLFEMEEPYGLQLKEIDGEIYICFSDRTCNQNLRDWYEEQKDVEILLESASDKDKEQILKDYNFWKWNYPKALADANEQIVKKKLIQDRIEQLQQELKKMDEEL